MELPYPVINSVNGSTLSLWNSVYKPSKDTLNDKTIEEGLWRRSQDFRNHQCSGWKNSLDKRRKIMHYKHAFALIKNEVGRPQIVLVDTVIHHNITLPQPEIEQYIYWIDEKHTEGNWKELTANSGGDMRIFENDNLTAMITLYKPSQNKNEYTPFPANYRTLDTLITRKKTSIESAFLEKPWGILKSGFRNRAKRGEPTYISSAGDIANIFPAQLLIGCGPAHEAGIPPLHELHTLYSIEQTETKKFIFNLEEDVFFKRLFSNPVALFERMAMMLKAALNASLTDFYFVVKKLYDDGKIVGPIITNNFDGLHLRLGLNEIYVRKYEEDLIVPNIQFDPQAKSLMVVGCHADRRKIEEKARRRDLQIVYIDTEGWWEGEKFYPYPLESPQTGDLIWKTTASTAFKEIYKYFYKSRK